MDTHEHSEAKRTGKPFNGKVDEQAIALHMRDLLSKGLGLDLSDPNFLDTPARVARAYREIFGGLDTADAEISKIFKTCFPTDYDGIVMQKNIRVYSMCPHHFLPVVYDISVGYIPKSCGIGLSKLTRIIELLAKKPVLQETFTKEIITLLDKHMKPRGAIVTVTGDHFCMKMRGVKQKDVVTTTSSASGAFLERDMELKFYELVRHG